MTDTSGADSPDFSSLAASYAASRPVYPPELFAWLASVAERHDAAWDVATGNGQAAIGVAAHFERVIATDRSAEQIRHARPHPRVEYRVAQAEDSGLPASSVDLVSVAAAAHWFDLARFADEVRRVGRSGAVVAAWTYHVAHAEPPFDAILGPFCTDVVRPYFASGADLVDDRYRSLSLPGEELEAPAFTVSVRWTAEQILAFVRTWSGVDAFRRAHGRDPVEDLAPEVERACGGPDREREVRWPLYLRASRLP